MNQPIFAKITATSHTLVLHSSYHHQFIGEMKAVIPADKRKWDAATKTWVFDPSVLTELRDLCKRHYGSAFTDGLVGVVPLNTQSIILDHQRIVVDYITHARDGICAITALAGISRNNWDGRVIVAETVLKAYFDPLAPEDTPQEQKQIPSTHYAVLGIKSAATSDEIKSAWRRGLKTWHPDVCQEPDAKEWFAAVQKAYNMLTTQRAKYDAALKLIATQASNQSTNAMSARNLTNAFKNVSANYFGYTPPVRCGIVDCKVEIGGLYPRILLIYDWKDITRVNARGETETRITYWDNVNKKISERWEVL